VNFEKVPITIDYLQKQLRIETKSSIKEIARAAQSLPIKLHQFGDLTLDIFVPVCVNGKIKLDMELDTGSEPNDILINSKFLQTLGVDTSKTKNSIQITPFSKKLFKRFVAIIDSVQFCGLQNEPLKNVRVDFKEDIIYEGLIGAGYFKEFPFTIDIANKRILVKRSLLKTK
jgi:hypothetical protein